MVQSSGHIADVWNIYIYIMHRTTKVIVQQDKKKRMLVGNQKDGSEDCELDHVRLLLTCSTMNSKGKSADRDFCFLGTSTVGN